MRKILTIAILLFMSSCFKKMETKIIQVDSINAIIDTSTYIEKPIVSNAPSDPLIEVDTMNIDYPFNVYRKGNEIFLYDSSLSKEFQITKVNGAIDTFYLSPNRKYVACRKKMEYVDDRWWYGVFFINNQDRKLIKGFEAPTSGFLFFKSWISNSRCILTTSDGFAVSEYYVYDAYRDTVQRVNYGYPIEYN